MPGYGVAAFCGAFFSDSPAVKLAEPSDADDAAFVLLSEPCDVEDLLWKTAVVVWAKNRTCGLNGLLQSREDSSVDMLA